MAERPVSNAAAAEEYRLKSIFEDSGSKEEYVTEIYRLMDLRLKAIEPAAVAAAVDAIETAFEHRATVYAMGNGGSAAVASHFVNDMGVNSLVDGKAGCRLVSLSDNVESITAVANDAGYENVFLYQLRCQLQPGDVLIGMSVSGNSPNILRAVEYANLNGATTIGFCGFDGGKLLEAATLSIHVPSTRDEYGPVEDIFSILCHMISGYIAMRRGRFLHH